MPGGQALVWPPGGLNRLLSSQSASREADRPLRAQIEARVKIDNAEGVWRAAMPAWRERVSCPRSSSIQAGHN